MTTLVSSSFPFLFFFAKVCFSLLQANGLQKEELNEMDLEISCDSGMLYCNLPCC